MSEPEPQVWSDDDLAALIGLVEVSSLGPTNWHFSFEHKRVTVDGREAWLVWTTCDRIDYDTGLPSRGRGRDMILWCGTQRSGVVKTMFVLFQQFVTHEMMHAFRYRGKELFDPHAPVDLLHSIAGRATSDSYNRFAPIVPPSPNYVPGVES